MAVDINLDEFERRLRAAGAQPADLEDPLFELARLVESSGPAAGSGAPPLRADVGPPEPLERVALRPAFDESTHDQVETAEVEASQVAAFQDFDEKDLSRAEQPVGRRSFGWKLKVSALAIAGVAMIGAVGALRGGVPGLPKQPPDIAAAQGPTKVLPPSDETVSASNDAGATLLKDNTQSAQVKVVASEEQPVDLNALASSAAAPAPAAPAPAAPADASAGSAVKGTVDTPVVVATAAPPPPAPPQFPDPKPVRTVSLRPDGTPIPSPAVASADAGEAAPAAEAPKPAPKPTPKAATDAANAQPSSPRLDLPTKLSAKSSARVAVAKTDTTAPTSIAEAANEPIPLRASAKSDKAAKPAKSQQAAAEPAALAPQVASAASAAPNSPVSQQPDNPLLHAFGNLLGSNAAPAAPAAPIQQAVDSAAGTKSSGWAVQLGAPKSEAEAKSDMARLNAKYASALNGSTIGVHKAVVNGEAIYRLRVVGLSNADAAALCARLKGDGGNCFIAK